MRVKEKPQQKEDSHVVPVVERNIEALIATRRAEEKQMGWEERMASGITRFMGSLLFVLIHVIIYGLWIAINQGWIPGLPRFDPTLVVLAMEASVEAIFLSTFILITQRRMMAQSERRAELNLQISLLAEYEITRLVTVTKEMAKAMHIKEADQPELEEIAREITPEHVLEKIDEHERKFRDEQSL